MINKEDAPSGTVNVLVEVDLDEKDIDHIGGDVVPRYFIDGNNIVHQCWIVRAGKSDSEPYGKLIQPLTEERILELAKKYYVGANELGEFIGPDDMNVCIAHREILIGFVRAIEKEILGDKD